MGGNQIDDERGKLRLKTPRANDERKGVNLEHVDAHILTKGLGRHGRLVIKSESDGMEGATEPKSTEH
jgi:hypothetical protein